MNRIPKRQRFRLWLDNFLHKCLGGHISIGSRKSGFYVVIYGRNAMHYAVNIFWGGKGYLCFRLPFFCYGKWWKLYLYYSPDATPQRATFMIGSDE